MELPLSDVSSSLDLVQQEQKAMRAPKATMWAAQPNMLVCFWSFLTVQMLRQLQEVN